MSNLSCNLGTAESVLQAQVKESRSSRSSSRGTKPTDGSGTGALPMVLHYLSPFQQAMGITIGASPIEPENLLKSSDQDCPTYPNYDLDQSHVIKEQTINQEGPRKLHELRIRADTDETGLNLIVSLGQQSLVCTQCIDQN